jgi:hypothetical protein
LFGTAAPELLLHPDWSRHQLEAAFRGTLDRNEAGRPIDGPALEGMLRGRVDIARDTAFTLEANYQEAREEASDPDLPAGAAERPRTRTAGLSGTLRQGFNRLSLGLTGSFGRHSVDDVALADGGIASGAGQNYTELGWRLRAGRLRALPQGAAVRCGARQRADL